MPQSGGADIPVCQSNGRQECLPHQTQGLLTRCFLMMTRRGFLGHGANLSALTLGGVLPGLFARAADAAAKADRNDRILVIVELAGGNDGLNMVIPFEDDRYHKARP